MIMKTKKPKKTELANKKEQKAKAITRKKKKQECPDNIGKLKDKT